MTEGLFDLATKKPVKTSSPEEAEAAFRSGKVAFAKGSQVPVVNQDGEVGTLPESELSGALAAGVRLASPEQVDEARAAARHAADKAKYGPTSAIGEHLQHGITQGASLLRGATAGLSDEAAVDLGYLFGGDQGKHEVAGRLRYAKEEHPYESGFGELEGMVLPSLIPGGGAVGAGGRALGAAGHGVESLVARGLARQGAGALERIAAKGVASGAGAAFEGAFRGAGEQVTEAALGETELTAEKVLAGATHGAVSWGLAGGVLGGAGAAFGEAASAGRNAIGRFVQKLRPADVDSVAEKQFGYVPEGLGKLWERAQEGSAALSGGDIGTIRKLTDLSPAGAEARRIAVFDAPVIREQASREVRTQLDALLDSSREITAEAKGGLKASYIESAVKKGNEAEALAFARQFASDTRAHVTDMIANPKEYGLVGSLKGMHEWLDGLDASIERTARGEPASLSSEVDALDSAYAFAKRTGVRNGEYIREGLPRIEGTRAAYEGASQEEANAIATGRAPARGSGKELPPIKLHAEDGKLHLTDGRHRLQAAQEAGATEIRATLRTEFRGKTVEREVIVPIEATEGISDASLTKNANGRLFVALDETKRAFGRWTKAAQAVEKKSDPLALLRGRATRDRLQGIYEDMRKSLENGDVWGKAAEDQAAINQAWAKQIDAGRVFDSKLTTNVGRDPKNPWVDIRKVDPAKADAYVSSLTNPNNDLVHQAIRNYVDATKEVTETIGRAWELPPEKLAHVAKVADSTKAFSSSLDKAEKALTLANQFQALRAAEQGSGVGDMLSGALIGGGVGGPLGAIAGGVAGAMAKPAGTVARLAALERLTQKVDLRIGSSIRGFLKSAPDRIRAATTPAALTVGRKAGESTDAVFMRAVAQITELASNPASATTRMSDSLAGLEQAAPNTSAALSAQTSRVTAFLASKVPPGMTDPFALSAGHPRPLVSEYEKARFFRYLAAANDPTSVLDDMQHGRLTPEGVEAMKACYPKLYEETRASILDHLVSQKSALPYAKRVQLGTLFDAPTDATLDPTFLQAIAGHQASASAEAEAAGPGMKGGPPAKELRVADSFQTTAEAATRREDGTR